jgi:hypothetical protein
MLLRYIDVFFEHAVPFVVLLMAVPLVATGIYVATDRSQTVTARVWADGPAILGDFALQQSGAGSDPPAAIEAALSSELVQTDSFLDPVIRQADVEGSVNANAAVVRESVRTHLQIAPDGPNEVLFTYTTNDAPGGIRFLGKLLASFGPALQALELNAAAITGRTLDTQVQAALTDMQQATGKLQAYVATVPYGEQRSLQTDPAYSTLAANARAATTHYLNLVAAMQQAQLVASAIPAAESQRFQILDPPAVAPRHLSISGMDVRIAAVAGLGAMALEALLIFLLGSRGTRVRAGADAARRLRLRYLGSVPSFGHR